MGDKPHRYRGELPEVRHQPGMGIGGQAPASDLLAELAQLLLADAAFQEGAGVDAGRRVALEKHQVAAMVSPFCELGAWKKWLKPDVVQRRGRSEAGDVAAQLRALAIGLHHHGHARSSG